MNRRQIVCLTIVLVGCADSPAQTGVHAVDAANSDALAATLDCECFWDLYGFSSETACRDDADAYLLDSTIASCFESAGESYPEFEQLAQCQMIASSERYLCYQDFQDSCNPDAFDDCDDAEEAAIDACDAYDPCLGLSGSALADCNGLEAQLMADFLDCVR